MRSILASACMLLLLAIISSSCNQKNSAEANNFLDTTGMDKTVRHPGKRLCKR